jgi:hydroxypyruvate isomerase
MNHNTVINKYNKTLDPNVLTEHLKRWLDLFSKLKCINIQINYDKYIPGYN